MNTAPLSKLYDRLQPAERVPLLLAADLRGDEVEYQRLMQSCPRSVYRVPDVHGVLEGFRYVVLEHLLRMLDLAALFWQTLAFDDGDSPRAINAHRLASYLLVTRRDGWVRFCEACGIEPDGLLKQLPGYDTVIDALDLATDTAFSPAEAVAYWQDRFQAEPAFTPERIATIYQGVARCITDVWE